MYKLQIIYVYNIYNKGNEDRDFIKFDSDKTYKTYKDAISMAKSIMECNEDIFVNIIEVQQ